MSIYSGFATRNLETNYNKTVGRMLLLMQNTLIRVVRNGMIYTEKTSFEDFGKEFLKTFQTLRALEQQKHLQPKFSEYCMGMARELEGEVSINSHNNQASFTNINTELDFHILNDVMAYDSSRVGTRGGEERQGRKKFSSNLTKTESQIDESGNSQRKVAYGGLRIASNRPRPNLIENMPSRGYSSATKKKKKRNLSPALLYHEQAMDLLQLNNF